MANIRDHIESNHITGISIPCDTCGKAFKSRNSLCAHKSPQHRKKINEFEVNKFNVIFLDRVEDIFGGSHIEHSFM